MSREMKRPLLRRVEFVDGSVVVFELPAGAPTTRAAVQLHGRPICGRGRGAAGWVLWPGERRPPRAAHLDAVPLADPDPEAELRPARFEVVASTWCAWPTSVREVLRAVCSWSKVPGAMATDHLDGATAERVREVGAQHGLAGLNEADDA